MDLRGGPTRRLHNNGAPWGNGRSNLDARQQQQCSRVLAWSATTRCCVDCSSACEEPRCKDEDALDRGPSLHRVDATAQVRQASA